MDSCLAQKDHLLILHIQPKTLIIFYFYFSLCSYVLDINKFKAKDIIFICISNFLLFSIMILLKVDQYIFTFFYSDLLHFFYSNI